MTRLKKIILPILLLPVGALCLWGDNPAEAADPLKVGYGHYKSGNHQAAVQVLTQAVKGKHKANPQAHYMLGNAWMKLGNPGYARHYYHQSLRLKPKEPLRGYLLSALKGTGTPTKGSGKGAVGIAFRENLIVEVQPGGSGERAGLKAGDKIISIDRKSTYGLGTNAVAKLLVGGPPGSKVVIGVNRAGTKQVFTVTRGVLASSSGTTRSNSASSRSAGISRGPVQISAKDRTLIKIHKNKKTENTDYILNQVSTALSYLSVDTKDVLRNGGCTILIAPSIVDACPELRTQKPGGYLHGGSYHNCPGMFMPSKKTLYIAEKASWRNGPPQRNSMALSTTLHELGHAYDHCRGNLSRLGPFKKVSKLDHQKLTNTNRERYWYYTQPGRGDAELFAEMFAVVHGKKGLDDKAAQMPGVFPNTTKYMKALLNR